MITVIFMCIMFILHFQIIELATYFLQYKTISAISILQSIQTSQYHNLIRIITSNLFHNGLNHLLINMIAFLNFGISLEDFFGHFNKYLYLKILLGLMIFSGLFSVLFHYLAYLISGNIRFYQVQSCGFSAVLFGLQFIFYYLQNNDFKAALQHVLVHLFYIFLLVPNTSTFGHLAGVASGITVAKLIKL